MTPTPLRALLVEDDDGDALLFERLVADRSERGGVSTIRACNLGEAVVRVRDESVDVVLLDLGLPDSQGLATFEAFHAAVPDLPVVVLTGMHDRDVALAAIEAGAQDYVVKDDLAAMPLDRVMAHAVERQRLQARLLDHARVLGEQRGKLQSLFDKSLDAFLLVDDAGAVREANPAAEALMARSSQELVGREFGDLVRDMHGDRLVLAEVRQLGDDTVTGVIPRPAGRAAEVELRLTADVVPGEHLVSIRDVSERNLTQRQLKASEARFRDLVELADDALYRVRLVPELRVDYISPAIEVSTGVAAADLYAEPGLLNARIHPADRPAWGDLARLREGASDRVVVRWRLPDDSWAWLEDRRTPIFEDGCLVAIQGILRDVSLRERTEEALRDALRQEREAVEKLQSLDRMKGTFLQALSHELRTPLTVIRGFALTLERHGDTMGEGQRAVLVSRLNAASERLERLLVDLLDVDRLTRGVVPVDRRPTDVRALVDGVLAEVDLHRHEVWVECPHDLIVSLDAAKVERILENLLRNAVKHTPAGTHILVVVTGNERGIVLTVEDDGPGIAPELLERIFDPFEQGVATNAKASPGTGIGLALVAKFAELHGGQAWVDPAIGGGATFVVDLPANASVRDGGHAPAGRGVTGPATSSRDAVVVGDAVVADTVRQLLHATDLDEIPGILVTAVDRLGGHTTVDELESLQALPLDLSLGLGRPLFAAAPPATPARASLEAHLPRLVEDAQRAAQRCRQLAAGRRPAAAPAPVEPATALADLLDGLGAGDAVLSLRLVPVVVPSSEDAVAGRAAMVVRACVRIEDRVFVTGDTEVTVLLQGGGSDAVHTVLDRVLAAARDRLPDHDVQVGIAHVDQAGGAVAYRRSREFADA